MGATPLRVWIGLTLIGLFCGATSVKAPAAPPGPGGADLPGALVTGQTKQVYRFHFSGLQGDDAVRFAGQLAPVVAHLPADNPLRRTLNDAKDRAAFVDEYRSLRAIFLETGVDTIYFLAEAHWIDSLTLPGRIALPGDSDLRDRLQRRLQAAGHDVWAAAVGRMETPPKATGWLVADVGAPGAAPPSPEKRALLERALQTSCPIRPATVRLDRLPALHLSLNHATPITVVNLERSQLDDVLTRMLATLVPATDRTAELLATVQASTTTASTHPMVHVRQVLHLDTPAVAAAMAAEIQKRINGAVQRIVDLDEDVGPLLGLVARSTALVAAVGEDVHVILKPPVLFDWSQAQSKALEARDLDWTALPAPAGYHWEIVGALGVADRRDVFARVRGVRVRGGTSTIAPNDPNSTVARFQIPLPDSELVLFRNLKGQLKVDVAANRDPPAEPPALEMLDDQGRTAAVLRLDLGPGDPRYDLARSRAVLAKRIAERTASEQTARKAADSVENAHQRAKLEGAALTDPAKFNEWQDKLRSARRAHRFEQAALAVFQELDDEARETQRSHPGATLAQDDGPTPRASAAWNVDRRKFPFAGQWLFDHGLLTLYQDADGTVAGVFATKVFQYTAALDIDRTQPTTGSAILVGRANGSTLPFTMYNHQGRERTGKLVLNADRTGGTWTLESTEVETDRRPPVPPPVVDPLRAAPGFGPPGAPPAGKNPRKKTAKSPPSPFQVAPPPSNPFPKPPAGPGATGPLGGLPFALPTPRRPRRGDEPARNGSLDRIETAAPEPLWRQDRPTSSFTGYWVHATDKRMNILFKASPSRLLSGLQGDLPVPDGNLRAAAVGRLLLILENVNVELITTPSVRGALLAPTDDRLVYLAERAQAPSQNAADRSGRPLELTRDGAE